ncbi:acetyltransferase [alpha proteobacterium AAP81b]|nr:acetyltransferase [alpha proteobacterium AAP81b]
MLDRQPTLADAHLHLRPLAPGDWPALFAVASDPAIWAQHPVPDRWQEPVFRRYFEEALASRGALIAIDRLTGAPIGASRYDHGRALPGEVEIGWTFLARDRWGGTWNHAMKRLMLTHAFAALDDSGAPAITQAIFLIGETNTRSRRAMAAIGGVLTDRVFTYTMSGVDVRHLVYAITREGFAAGPLGSRGKEAGPPAGRG